MNKLFLFFSIVLIASYCKSQNNIPTVESINGKYYNIMPKDKNIMTVNVKIKEFESALTEVSTKALILGDTVLAKNLLDLHTKVIYDRAKDTIIVDLSPVSINENSPLFEGVEKIKLGFKTSVFGCFLQIKSSILNDIISGYILKPNIEIQSDSIIVSVIKKDNTELYKFSKDYKEIRFEAKYPEQEFNGLFKAKTLNNKVLIINYIELITSQFKIYLDFKYEKKAKKIILQELKSKGEMPGISYSLTYLFWNWDIK